MAATHKAVFDELLRRFPRGEENQRLKEPYAWLYSSPGKANRVQEPNCAVLYAPDSERYGSCPLHLNDTVDSWQPAVFEKIKSLLWQARSYRGWRCYRVPDDAWDRFAEAIGL